MTHTENLEKHTYLNKQGNPIKNPRINSEQVLEAYSYLIEKSKGKLTTRILRLTFTDKAKDFTNILCQSGFIKQTKKSNTIKVTYGDGGSEYVSTPNQYTCSYNVSNDITNNRYINTLYNKLESRKDEYGWLYDIIADTISRTTLDGKNINQEFKYKKGRYYASYTGENKDVRKRLKIDGKKTLSYDIKSSVFQLLSYNKVDGIEALNIKGDIYEVIGKEFNLSKEEILQQVFCDVWQQDKRLDIIPFFSTLRTFKYNHGYKMVHTIYQILETKLMNDIYTSLALNKIDFLPMHDSLIFKECDYSKVTEMVKSVTKVEFKIEY